MRTSPMAVAYPEEPLKLRRFSEGQAAILHCGGLGNDILYGGTGNDSLYGQAGNDCLDGGTGQTGWKGMQALIPS